MYIILLGIALACLTVWFWYIELEVVILKVKELRVPRKTWNTVRLVRETCWYVIDFIGCLLSLWGLLTDLACTYLLTKLFFGSGGLGIGIIGLAASDFASLLILYIMKWRKK